MWPVSWQQPFGAWPTQENLETAKQENLEPPLTPRRLEAVQVLNRWRRDKDNTQEVIDFLVVELDLIRKYDIPPHN
jgi:hypothetical protein